MSDPNFQLPFFTNLLILLATAKILGVIFEILKQPAMNGEIIAGVLLGPSMLNLIHRTDGITAISDLGVFLLVIIAGLQLSVDEILNSLRSRRLFISIMSFLIPILSGIGVGYYFQQNIMTCFFIGLCLSITALPVSVRFLMDLGKLNSEVGKNIIFISIFIDVLALSVLGVLLEFMLTNKSEFDVVKYSFISILKIISIFVFLSIAHLVIRYALRNYYNIKKPIDKSVVLLNRKGSPFALFFIFILLFSAFTEVLGFHFIVGAFFSSILISDSLIGKKNMKAIERTLSNMTRGFLASIFFAGIGLEFNMSSISNIGLFISIIIVSYLSKFAGGYFGGIMAGYSKRISYTIGIGLNARGILELAIANIAHRNGLITTEVFSILVIMGVLTTLTTPLMLSRAFSRLERL